MKRPKRSVRINGQLSRPVHPPKVPEKPKFIPTDVDTFGKANKTWHVCSAMTLVANHETILQPCCHRLVGNTFPLKFDTEMGWIYFETRCPRHKVHSKRKRPKLFWKCVCVENKKQIKPN